MKQTEMIKVAGMCTACLCIAWTMASCSKGNDANKNGDNEIASLESPTGVVVAAEEPKKLTQVEQLEARSRRLVAEAGRIKGWTWTVSCDLCNEICKLPKEERCRCLTNCLKWRSSNR